MHYLQFKRGGMVHSFSLLSKGAEQLISSQSSVSVRPRSGDILVVLDNSELPLKVDLVI